jgi:AcrR family transcriptional regulator
MNKPDAVAADAGQTDKLTKKGQARRSTILDSAAHLFATEGYQATSISQIAIDAVTTKANVYHYFRSKHDMLFALHQEWMDELFRLFEINQRENGDDPAAVVRRVFKDLLLLVNRWPDRVIVYNESAQQFPDDLARLARARRNEYQKQVENVVQTGIDRGVFAVPSPRMATYAIWGVATWVSQTMLHGAEKVPPRVPIDDLYQLVIHGIAGPTHDE